MKRAFAFLFRVILSLRYRVQFIGTPLRKSYRSTLILPNHPAEIDPVIISAFLWEVAQPRPVVLETFYKLPIIHSILKMTGAIPMPDMELGTGFYKLKRIEQALKDSSKALDNGDNILIYPSGRLSLDGREVIGGASGLHKIIKESKNCQVLLLRTRGLWGSRFSKACSNGRRPDLAHGILSSINCILINLLFFVPKRSVQIEVKEVSIDNLRSLSITELNLYLQNFYDADGGESFKPVKNHFLGELPRHEISTDLEPEHEIQIDSEIKTQLINKLAEISNKSTDLLKSTSKLSEDLALDSLTIAEFVVWLQDEMQVTDVDLAELRTINDVLRLIRASNTGHKENAAVNSNTPAKWIKLISSTPATLNPEDFNLALALVRSCIQNSNMAALADPVLGVKKYIDLLRAALLFKKTIDSIQGKRIAVLLPASGSAAIITLAIWMAGKTPVFLNWTSGTRNLDHAVKSLDIEQIITAGSVLDKINSDLSSLSNYFILLEEVKQSWTLPQKLQAICLSILPFKILCRHLSLYNIEANQPAAILFTSGSEAFPKTVPLTHDNILSNIKDIFKSFGLLQSDVFYGFLPPFHSFGLTVTTILPLIAGMRVAFHPNPNESRKIAQGCLDWRITAMAGTPSFLKGVFSSATSDNFNTLRLVVSGAERLPEDIRVLIGERALKANILEGYGITECSPVVCVQRPELQKYGVGPALPGVRIKIVDYQTLNELPKGQTGLVLVNGKSVFSGYLNSDNNPFINIENEQWYNSGDLGYIENNCLVLAGRLKRFIKIGGEMISLPAIEEALEKGLNQINEQYQFAVVDSEDPQSSRSSLYLFSNFKTIQVDQVNELLRKSGFTALTKIKEVRFIEEMPILGSGKIDLQKLKEKLH